MNRNELKDRISSMTETEFNNFTKKFTEVIKFIEESYSDIEISKIEDIQ